MSELDVLVIHIRAEQAAEYERLFAEHELPRWRQYKASGAFISARMFRSAFGTDTREDVAKSSLSRCPATRSTASMTPIRDSRSSTAWWTACSRSTPWYTAATCCTPCETRSATGSLEHRCGGDARPRAPPPHRCRCLLRSGRGCDVGGGS
jgi:hypothetical protein